jgi:protein-arginine kinase activator protein McsA
VQELQEQAIRQEDFESAAKYRDETDRIKREIEDRFRRLGDE